MTKQQVIRALCELNQHHWSHFYSIQKARYEPMLNNEPRMTLARIQQCTRCKFIDDNEDEFYLIIGPADNLLRIWKLSTYYH